MSRVHTVVVNSVYELVHRYISPPDPSWRVDDLLLFTPNPGYIQPRLWLWQGGDATELNLDCQVRDLPKWYGIPIESTRRHTNAVKYFQAALDAMVTINCCYIELLPSDEWLRERLGDTIDPRVYAYVWWPPTQYWGGGYIGCSVSEHYRMSQGVAEQFAVTDPRVGEKLAEYIASKLVVQRSVTVLVRTKHAVGRLWRFPGSSGCTEIVVGRPWPPKSLKEASAIRAAARPGMTAMRFICDDDDVAALVQRINSTRWVNDTPLIFIGSPDRDVYSMAFYPSLMFRQERWFSRACIRRPCQYELLIRMSLLFHTHAAPFELLPIASQLEGMLFLPLYERRDVLIATYASIRKVMAARPERVIRRSQRNSEQSVNKTKR